LEALGIENARLIYGHLEYLMAIWYIIGPFGIFNRNLVYFASMWNQEKSGNPVQCHKKIIKNLTNEWEVKPAIKIRIVFEQQKKENLSSFLLLWKGDCLLSPPISISSSNRKGWKAIALFWRLFVNKNAVFW
jgi:hypothetical protein